MANLRSEFSKFHDAIKIGTYDDSKTLREKRDLLLDNLRDKLPEDAPGFSSFNQGSYAMNTGIQPVDGDYDIDIGLIFETTPEDYQDPVELKKMVRDALGHPQRTIAIRRPCVTVTYLQDGDPQYHVDLAIYCRASEGSDDLRLATGKEHSEESRRIWQESDPKGLIQMVADRFEDSDQSAQMRRCIRYLKRWRDECLYSGKPVSIALTCAAYAWFLPVFDSIEEQPKDHEALLTLCQSMLDRMGPGRLIVRLPVEPYNDLMARVTDSQMDEFRERLTALRDALDYARTEPQPEKASKELRKHFGEDFPEASDKTSAKKVMPAVITSGTSA